MSGVRGRRDVDLDACAREPIHIPGAIQPHGALVVLDPSSLSVRQASRNVADWLGADVGEALREAQISVALETWRESGDGQFQWSGLIRGRELNAVAHRSEDRLILEFEEAPAAGPRSMESLFPRLRSFAETLPSSDDFESLLGATARFVRSVTGFDRVLVYRFDKDWNGQVVGEDGNGVLPSYLDLRFPADDIPAQARQLYRINRLRIIPDAAYDPVPIVRATEDEPDVPVDLSLSLLRSVSPVHVEYMRNMGTAASMSISILFDGELWGLVACHSLAPHRVSIPVRNVCDFAVQILASEVSSRERSAQSVARVGAGEIHARLLDHIASAPDWKKTLCGEQRDLLALVGASGAVIASGEEALLSCGTVPADEDVRDIVAWLEDNFEGFEGEVFSTDSVASGMPAAKRFAAVASGMLAIRISELHPSWVIWFRPEVVRTVRWGGDPHKVVKEKGRIHPRRSFETWKEQVGMHGRDWGAMERDAAANLRAAIVNIVLRRAEELAQLAEDLQRSNKELEAFSYSISHDLRAPFRHIVGYAELLRDRENDLDPKSAHYLESITESALAAGQLVDDLLNFSHVGRAALAARTLDMKKLVREVRQSLELKTAGRTIRWTIGDLPSGFGDPTLIRQVWFNLIENAIKYTGPREEAAIAIEGERRDGETVYAISDNGVGFDMAYRDKLFGVFQRLQRTEDFEGTGIGLALVRRIIERHCGRISAQGEVDQGSRFQFTLPTRDQGAKDV